MVKRRPDCESDPMESDDQAEAHVPREPAVVVPAVPAVSRLPLLAMGALVVFAVLLALALGLRGTTEFADGSPEAAVQAYLEAALDGDDEAVLALLTADQVDRCRNELTRYGRSSGYEIDGVGFALDSMTVTGDAARASLTQRTTGSGDPFAGTRRNSNQFVELRRENGEWRIEGTSWPWRIVDCLRAQ